ncbi:MAG: HAMP domain-containing protein [Fibrobacteria bacterium]
MMMRHTAVFTRIRFRILGIVLLAIIPAVLLIWYSAAERKRQISGEIEDNTLRLSRFLASNLERDLSEGEGYLSAVAHFLKATRTPANACAEPLGKLLGSATVYSNIGLAGANGKILCTARLLPSDPGLAGLEWFRKLDSSSGYSVGFDLNGGLSPQASIVLVLPLSIMEEGKGAGRTFLFSVMELDWLNKLAETSHLPPGSAISVTNRKGDAVARYPDPDKWVGKARQSPRGLGDGTALEGTRMTEGIDGVRRLYAYANVAGVGGLVVNVGVIREAMLAPASRALASQLIALGIVAILALMAAWFGADVFLLKQVRALVEATKKLGTGNLQARSSLSYESGELGELAQAFDEMAETLEWRNAQLMESEHERANSVSRLFDFIEYVPEPILILDEGFSVVACNGEAANLFECGADSLVGQGFSSLCPLASMDDIVGQVTRLPGQVEPGIHRFRSKMGRNGDSIPGIAIDISLAKIQVAKTPYILVILKRVAEPIPKA